MLLIFALSMMIIIDGGDRSTEEKSGAQRYIGRHK